MKKRSSSFGTSKNLESTSDDEQVNYMQALSKHVIQMKHVTILNDNKPIGSGAFATVYHGMYQNEHVAIKQLLDRRASIAKDVARFLHEAFIFTQLQHANIVPFIGCAFPPFHDKFVIVTRFCERGDVLASLKVAPFSLLQILQVALQLAEALQYLHQEKQMVHRDVKSLNVLLDAQGQVQLCDFSYCKKLGSIKRHVQHGTPRWMAPECLRNENYTFASDVFSFSIILWELAHPNQKPYPNLDVLQVIDMVGHKKYRMDMACDLYVLPLTFVQMVQDCWQEDPTQRPSMHVIVQTLQDLITKQ